MVHLGNFRSRIWKSEKDQSAIAFAAAKICASGEVYEKIIKYTPKSSKEAQASKHFLRRKDCDSGGAF